MDISKKIEMALTYANVSKSELARRLSVTPANVGQKLRRGTFSIADCEKIAEIIGAEFEFSIVFPDGMKI